MSEAGKFSCTSCHRTYLWKQELAGKKVRCKCGAAVSIPKALASESEHSEPELDDLYALAGDHHAGAQASAEASAEASGDGLTCPSCQSEVEAGAVLCLSCGFNFKTGRKIQTAVGGPDVAPARPVLARPMVAGVAPVAAIAPGIAGGVPRTLGYAGRVPQVNSREAENAQGMLKNLTWPIVMVVVGLIMMFAHQMFSNGYGPAGALIMTGVTTAIDVFFITIGCLIAIKIMDFSLGAPGEAILKIMAVALVPGAIGGAISVNVPMGFFLAMAVSLGFYWALLAWFFDLDGSEVMILTVIIWVVQFWIGGMVAAFLLAGALSGGSPAIAGGGGGGGPGAASSFFGTSNTKTDGSPAGRMNAKAELLFMRQDAQDAEEFLQSSEQACLMTMDRNASLKAIKDLQAAGAEEIYVADMHEYPSVKQMDKVIVTLPEDPKQREQIFALFAPRFENSPVGVPMDRGPDQAYLILNFDDNPD